MNIGIDASDNDGVENGVDDDDDDGDDGDDDDDDDDTSNDDQRLPLHDLAKPRDSGRPNPVLTLGGDDDEFVDTNGSHEAYVY